MTNRLEKDAKSEKATDGAIVNYVRLPFQQAYLRRQSNKKLTNP